MASLGREECGRFKWLSPVACLPAAVVYCSMTGVECCDLELPLDVVYCSTTDLLPPDPAFELEEDLAESVLMCLW